MVALRRFGLLPVLVLVAWVAQQFHGKVALQIQISFSKAYVPLCQQKWVFGGVTLTVPTNKIP